MHMSIICLLNHEEAFLAVAAEVARARELWPEGLETSDGLWLAHTAAVAVSSSLLLAGLWVGRCCRLAWRLGRVGWRLGWVRWRLGWVRRRLCRVHWWLCLVRWCLVRPFAACSLPFPGRHLLHIFRIFDASLFKDDPASGELKQRCSKGATSREVQGDFLACMLFKEESGRPSP